MRRPKRKADTALPPDLCLQGPGNLIEGDGYLHWTFRAESDLARRGVLTEVSLWFWPQEREFTAAIFWNQFVGANDIVGKDLAILQRLLPPAELARAIAFSITRTSS